MKKTDRLSFVLGMILLLAVIMSAVSASASTAGGWSVSKVRYSFLTSGQKKIFDKAVKKLTGVSYSPAAVLARQTVAGTNYIFLCQGTTVTAKPTKDWYVLTAYKDLKSKVSLSSVKKMKVSNIKVNKNPRQGTLDGGLRIMTFKNRPEALSKGVLKVFNKGIKKYTGYELRPISLLGTQVVAGKNYRFLCFGTGKAGKDLFVVDIYKDIKGKCSVSNCSPLNLEAYLK